jgi:hypothetical protein
MNNTIKVNRGDYNLTTMIFHAKEDNFQHLLDNIINSLEEVEVYINDEALQRGINIKSVNWVSNTDETKPEGPTLMIEFDKKKKEKMFLFWTVEYNLGVKLYFENQSSSRNVFNNYVLKGQFTHDSWTFELTTKKMWDTYLKVAFDEYF